MTEAFPQQHGPDWLWTLPGGLRPYSGETPWQDAAHTVHALSVQSALRPFVATVVRSGGMRGRIRSHWRWLAVVLVALMISAGWWWQRGGAVAWLGVWAVACLGVAQVLLRRWACQLSYDSQGQDLIIRWRSGLFWRPQQVTCPLSDYRGLARWSGAALHQAPFVTWTQRWWVVALVHRTDPTLSLPLLLSPSNAGLAAFQHRAAEALGLPVLLESVHGAGWLPYPAAHALLSLPVRLADDQAPRFSSAGSTNGLFPLVEIFPAGGAAAWLNEMKDRWLILLFCLPLGGLWGGPWGLLAGGLVPFGVGLWRWRAWQRGDGWRCDGHSLTLQRDGRQSVLPLAEILAVRFQDSASQPPAFEIETQSGTYRLRTGTAPRMDTQAALDRLLSVLQAVTRSQVAPK